MCVFFFKQKTAYDMRISDWSSDVCSSDLTADMVMASACLPYIFQAVEIDGVPYWDGGYMGNPALFPFFNASRSNDVIVVQINPVFRRGAPKSAREIYNRVNEITFNASLLRELDRKRVVGGNRVSRGVDLGGA